MTDHELQVISYGAGINIYTGTVQGGHAYATIRTPDGERIQLEREVTQAVIDEFASLDHTDKYDVGEFTARLLNERQAYELARAWMAANAPAGRLVCAGQTIYPQTGD